MGMGGNLIPAPSTPSTQHPNNANNPNGPHIPDLYGGHRNPSSYGGNNYMDGFASSKSGYFNSSKDSKEEVDHYVNDGGSDGDSGFGHHGQYGHGQHGQYGPESAGIVGGGFRDEESRAHFQKNLRARGWGKLEENNGKERREKELILPNILNGREGCSCFF